MNGDFQRQIAELLEANGWGELLVLEDLGGAPTTVRVRLRTPHPAEPDGLVSDYMEGMHSLEQIQGECLRALRTGRTGA